MDIINNNPYRLLGVYANTPIKERIANLNKIKAFTKVGKSMSFPLDLSQILPPISRTLDTVSETYSKLTLPNEQFKYAQFWFVKNTTFDDVAINHLVAGDIDEALSIWGRRNDASSLQNRIVCALIKKDYPNAIACAEYLYSKYLEDFIQLILGDVHIEATQDLAYNFIDTLSSELNYNAIMLHLSNKNWEDHIKEKAINPLVITLKSAIDKAKSSQGKGAAARYAAGISLIEETKATLTQLKILTSTADLSYQILVDKLGLEILQCGIDYYNETKTADAAHKAMILQSYALTVVAGNMAKARYKENVDILQQIIDNLPPLDVFAEDKVIKEELEKFYQLPDKICHAMTLLNNTKPHLQSIKNKLGAENAYYLKISTIVIDNALHNVIEEVNDIQKRDSTEYRLRIPELENASREVQIIRMKSVLKEAWKIIELMNTLDMESDFQIYRYEKNRSTLKNMCVQLGVSMTTPPTPPEPPAKEPPTPPEPPKPYLESCIAFIGIIGAIIGGIAAGGIWILIGAFIAYKLYKKFVD